MWPPAVASDLLKLTFPKSVSGTVRQRPDVSQTDGASAIHSAEDTSGAAIVRTLVKLVLRVRFWICTVTFVPFTLTEAESLFPAYTLSLTGTEPAGTSSYQAE